MAEIKGMVLQPPWSTTCFRIQTLLSFSSLEGERDYYKDLFESGIIQEFFEVIRDKEKVENQKKTIARLKEKIEYFKNEVSELKENKNKNKNKGGNK